MALASPVAFRAPALVSLLALGAVPAAASFTVTVEPPSSPLAPRVSHLLRATVLGEGERQPLAWKVQDAKGRELGERSGVFLRANPDDTASLYCHWGGSGRTLRVTASHGADAGRAELKVLPDPGPSGDSKRAATEQPRLETKAERADNPSSTTTQPTGRLVWRTPFSQAARGRQVETLAFDPTTTPFSVVAVDYPSGEFYSRQLARYTQDGKRTALDPEGKVPLAGSPDRSLAVRPDGGILVVAAARKQVFLVSRDGAVDPLEGMKDPGSSPDAGLVYPCGIAATPDGDTILCDRAAGTVIRVDSKGALKVLAGPNPPADATAPRNVPRMAPNHPAVTPDGRIHFLDEYGPTLYEILVDGRVRTAGRLPDRGYFAPWQLAITSDARVLAAETNDACLWEASRPDPDGKDAWRPLQLDLPRNAFPAPWWSQGSLKLAGLASCPGGGALGFGEGFVTYIANDRTDAGLAGQVKQALQDLRDRKWERVEACRASLERWAKWPKRPGEDRTAWFLRNRVSKDGLGLPDETEEHATGFLYEDETERGIAFRAQLALSLLDEAVDQAIREDLLEASMQSLLQPQVPAPRADVPEAAPAASAATETPVAPGPEDGPMEAVD